jgi:IS30 family transposase
MKYDLDLDKKIHQMRQQNKTLEEIAAAFGVSRETIRRKLQRHWRWQIHQERRKHDGQNTHD